MKKDKKNAPKKFSLDDFRTHAKTISSSALLETITGGLEDACHVATPPPSGGGGTTTPPPSGGSGGGGLFFTKIGGGGS